jgi:hypothetical protein
VKQIEDFEISRREFYDQKRESNAMYWMAFRLIMKRAKAENTRYLDFFTRKLAAEQTYVRCLVEVRRKAGRGEAPQFMINRESMQTALWGGWWVTRGKRARPTSLLAFRHSPMAFFLSGEQMKEESDKLKHGGEKKSALEVAFGAPRKNLLDDLLSVQEQMAEKCHAFQRVIEQEIVPAIEGMVRHIHRNTWYSGVPWD